MATRSKPALQCDLVMKGGITSGIVYPPALFELSKKYTFNSIGGTSAGAIAAATAAAAEYNRHDGGFERLNRLSVELGGVDVSKIVQEVGEADADDCDKDNNRSVTTPAKDNNHTLFHLFDPPRSTRPIISLGEHLGAFGGDDFWRKIPLPSWVVFIPHFVWAAARSNIIPFLIGGLGVGLLGYLIYKGLVELVNPEFPGWWPVVGVFLTGLFGLIGGALGALALVLWVVFKQVPKNFNGLVMGHDPNWDQGTSKPRMLIDWLSQQLDHIAGVPKGHPLTFGDLCREGVTLRMISTNLSHGLPYELPLADPQQVFLFKESEMCRLFPGYIVDYMIAHAPESSEYVVDGAGRVHRVPADDLPQGENHKPAYYFLPKPEHLPVAVAMRMSLSIPGFFSAVPLHTISARALERHMRGDHALQDKPKNGRKGEPGDFQVNWFTDGGTSSNFPIHFFDRWLPTRPTFGINLVPMPVNAIEVHAVEGEKVKESYLSGMPETNEPDAVVLPKADRFQPPEWVPVNGLFAVLGKMLDVARENHDNSQSMLPGYRERIVQIRFKESEGGINLAMTPATIADISKKGWDAGRKLRCDFDFDRHRWTRFLGLMARLEEEVERMDFAFHLEADTNKHRNYGTLIRSDQFNASDKTPEEQEEFAYYRDRAWLDETAKRVSALLEIVGKWKNPETLAPLGERATYLPEVSNDKSGVDGIHCDKLVPEYELRFFKGAASKKRPRAGSREPGDYPSPKPDTTLRVTPKL
jgi:predicted acylesterase/phospholipase RssA